VWIAASPFDAYHVTMELDLTSEVGNGPRIRPPSLPVNAIGLRPADPNDLSEWFPLLQATGIRVPRTTIIDSGRDDLLRVLDGDHRSDPELGSAWQSLIERITDACNEIGWPIFLRTGQGSGKHWWRDTCHVSTPKDVPSHVAELIEWSAVVDMMGLSDRFWAVREFLPLRYEFTAFRGMPVAREFRFFLRDGKVECVHPYWPEDTIRAPSCSAAEWEPQLTKQNQLDEEEKSFLVKLIEDSLAGSVLCDRYLSFDMAQLATGVAEREEDSWVAIDMALGEVSFHWPGCELSTEA
jgi:hypothetical protein